MLTCGEGGVKHHLSHKLKGSVDTPRSRAWKLTQNIHVLAPLYSSFLVNIHSAKLASGFHWEASGLRTLLPGSSQANGKARIGSLFHYESRKGHTSAISLKKN